MGKTWEARNTFERVLDIDPNSRLARENLREAIQFLRKQGATEEQLRFHGGSPKFERDGSFKYQHTVKPFPRIHRTVQHEVRCCVAASSGGAFVG